MLIINLFGAPGAGKSTGAAYIFSKLKMLGVNEEFNDLVAKIFKSYNSINYFIERDKPYNPKGRLQTEKKSDYLAEKIKDMLAKYDIQYENRRGNLSAYDKIVEDIYSQLLEYGIEVSDK